MASTTQIAKEKGNSAFKAGDFPAAIGHYTDAILKDRSDFTLPLNRAAAYLKLGKNEDAERDCATVLSLQAQNVKALFRCGQARVGQRKYADAQKDFKTALAIEPGNHQIEQELKAINALLEEAAKRSKARFDRGPLDVSDTASLRQDPTSKRELASGPPSSSARVLTPAPNGSDLLKPLSSRPLPPSEKSDSPIAKPSSPPSFMELKQAREIAKQSRIGGGISGKPTNFETRKVDVPSKPVIGGSSPKYPSTQPPVTLFDFVKAWESLDSPNQKWQYFSTIPPATLPALFQSSLETSILASLLEMFLFILNSDPTVSTKIKEYMLTLEKVPRFGMIVLLMNRDEKGLLKAVQDKLDSIQVAS